MRSNWDINITWMPCINIASTGTSFATFWRVTLTSLHACSKSIEIMRLASLNIEPCLNCRKRLLPQSFNKKILNVLAPKRLNYIYPGKKQPEAIKNFSQSQPSKLP